MLLCLIPFNCNSNIKGHTFLDRNSTVSFPNCNQKDIKSELMYRPICFCCMMMSCSERAQFVFCTILTWHRVMRCPQTPLTCWKMNASQNSNSQKLKTQDPHHLHLWSGTVCFFGFWILKQTLWYRIFLRIRRSADKAQDAKMTQKNSNVSRQGAPPHKAHV